MDNEIIQHRMARGIITESSGILGMEWTQVKAQTEELWETAVRLTDGGDLTLEPETNAGGVWVEAPVWSSGRTARDVQTDGIFYIKNWVNNAGQPWQNGAYGSYAKGFGVHARKNGAGNLDAHWASLQHYGNDEVGLFIGDATSHRGGNAWGGHFWVASNTTESALIGHTIELLKNATSGTKNATTLSANASAGATTLSMVANPGTGRFLVGSGSTQEFVSILSVTGSGPYTATLANGLAFAKTSGNVVTPYHAYSRGLHVTSSGSYDLDVALLVDRGSTGKWGDVLLYLEGSGPGIRTRIVGSKASTTEIIPTLDGGVIATTVRVDSRIDNEAARLQVVGPAGKEKRLALYSGNTLRYTLGTDATAETGSDAGANLALISYDDGGAAKHTIFSSNRINGVLHAEQGVATKSKAGAPVDADWTIAPANNTIVVDSTNSRLYVRVGGTWRYATLT